MLYLIARARGKQGVGQVALGFTIPTALVALAMGPSQLLYWTVLGNGSYVGMKTMSTVVLTTFLFMTGMWALCNLPAALEDPERLGRSRKLARARRRSATPTSGCGSLSAAVSVAVGLRFFGHYYMQLVPPLALLAAGALVARQPQVGRRARWPWRSRPASCSPRPGTSTIRACRSRTTNRCRATSRRTTNPDDPIYVWGSVPEIYWASGRRPATRFLTSSFLTGNYPGRPPKDANTGGDTKAAWDDFFKDFTAHPPKYFVDTSPAKLRGAQYYPISNFPRLEHIIDTQYRYVVTIDDIVVYKRK